MKEKILEVITQIDEPFTYQDVAALAELPEKKVNMTLLRWARERVHVRQYSRGVYVSIDSNIPLSERDRTLMNMPAARRVYEFVRKYGEPVSFHVVSRELDLSMPYTSELLLCMFRAEKLEILRPGVYYYMKDATPPPVEEEEEEEEGSVVITIKALAGDFSGKALVSDIRTGDLYTITPFNL